MSFLISNTILNKFIKIKNLFKIDFSWFYIQKVDIVFVLVDINCYYFYENKYYSPLIESLKEEYERQGLRCAIVYGPFSKFKSNKKLNKFNFNGSFSRSFLLRRFYILFFKEKNHNTKFISNIWTSILKKFNPKRVVGIYPSESLCLAARSINIDIAELQHGVINDNHPAYGYSFKQNININTTPTTFICFDKVAVDTFKKWVKNYQIKTELISNPWIKRFVEQNITDELVQNALKLNTWIYNLPFKKSILVTLGWGWEDENNTWLKSKHNTEFNMPQFHSLSLPMVDLILSNELDVNWLIRLHPVQMLNKEKKIIYNYLTSKFSNYNNVLWNETSNAPLALILQNINLHLTFDSTITTEASLFGVKSGLICPVPKPTNYLKGYYALELNNGEATFVPNNKNSLVSFIIKNLC